MLNGKAVASIAGARSGWTWQRCDQSPEPQSSPGHKIFPYLLRHMVIDRPNQVWAAVITYVPIGQGFLYLVAIIDWASRAVRAWRLSNTMDTLFCVSALEEVLARFGRPEIFNTDQGSQFTSGAFRLSSYSDTVLSPRRRRVVDKPRIIGAGTNAPARAHRPIKWCQSRPSESAAMPRCNRRHRRRPNAAALLPVAARWVSDATGHPNADMLQPSASTSL